MQKYLLSVITVVKNDQRNIQKTIKSIISQKKNNIEYIVIDGKSEDNTLKEVKKFKRNIDLILSEKDDGIYSAMNKGIKFAKGEIIVFCNSGDFFYKNSFKKILKLFKKKNFDFVFGTVLRNYTKNKILKYGFDFDRIKYNFDFATSHTTGFFLKKKIYKKIGNYNTKFKISADYDLYFRLYKGNFIGGYTSKKDKIGNVASGGYSSKRTFLSHLVEESKIRLHNKQNIFIVILIILNAIIKNFIK